MSEESVSSYRRPIVDIENYRERNKKKDKDYYYKKHDLLKSKMRERAQRKQVNIKEKIKLVTATVSEITICLERISTALIALDKPVRV